MTEISNLIGEILKFRDARLWERFHTSKDLAAAISIEAAELNELFLWKTVEECENADLQRLSEEIADILIFTFLLANKHNLSIKKIIIDKLRLNDLKYPIEKSRGSMKKYNEL